MRKFKLTDDNSRPMADSWARFIDKKYKGRPGKDDTVFVHETFLNYARLVYRAWVCEYDFQKEYGKDINLIMENNLLEEFESILYLLGKFDDDFKVTSSREEAREVHRAIQEFLKPYRK